MASRQPPQQSVCTASLLQPITFQTKQPADPLLSLFFARLPLELRCYVYELILDAADAVPVRFANDSISQSFWEQHALSRATEDTTITKGEKRGVVDENWWARRAWMLQSRQLFEEASDTLWRASHAREGKTQGLWLEAKLPNVLGNNSCAGGIMGMSIIPTSTTERPLFSGLAVRQKDRFGRDFVPYSLALTCRAVRQVRLLLRLGYDPYLYGKDMSQTPDEFAGWADRVFRDAGVGSCSSQRRLPRFPSLRRLKLEVSVWKLNEGDSNIMPLRSAVIQGRAVEWLRTDPSWSLNLRCLAGKLHHMTKESCAEVVVECTASKFGDSIETEAQNAIATALMQAYDELFEG